MDFLSAGMTKVVVLERWLLAEVQLYFLLMTKILPSSCQDFIERV